MNLNAKVVMSCHNKINFIPSTAALTIPPAYPAPSPEGYTPETLVLSNELESLTITTGEEVLVST